VATQFARECLFPEDLEAATVAMQELISDRLADNLSLLNQAQAAAGNLDALIDQGNAILQNLILAGDAATSIRNLSDLSTQFGTLDESPTLSDEEAFASKSGVIMFDSIAYLPGTSSPNAAHEDNIEILRKVYLAVGRSLSTVEEVYASPQSVVAYSNLSVQKIRPKRPGEAFSLSEIKALLGDPYVSQYAVLEDFSTIVLRSTYLGKDESLPVIGKKFGLQTSSIAVSVFHQDAVDNSTSSINKFQRYGFTDAKLSAILAGQDLVLSAQSPIQAQLTAEYAESASLIELENFVSLRFGTLGAQNKSTFVEKISARISALSTSYLATLTDSLFQVAIIREHDTLAQLRTKHSDDAIIRLLEERADITGLWWSPPDDAFGRALSQAMQSAPPGSSTLSNRYLNTQTFSKVDISEFMAGLADLDDAGLENTLTKLQLSNSSRNLTEFQNHQPLRAFSTLADGAAKASNEQSPALQNVNSSTVADPVTTATGYDSLSGQPPPQVGGVFGTSVVSGEPLQGQPSASSPASVFTDLFDPGKTLNMGQRIADVITAANDTLFNLYPPEIAAPLTRISNILASLFEQSMRTCARSVATARAILLPLKNKLDSFMSRFLTLTGSGSYEKSILKCITVNIGISLGALDNLLNIVTQIAAVAGLFLSAVAAWSGNLVDKIICLSSNLIDMFVGNVPPVPAGCVVPRISLGSDLTAALERMKFVGVAKTIVFGAFSRDTVRVKIIVESAPTRTNQFKSGTNCSSSQVSDFFNKSMLQIKIPTSPLGV